MKAEYIPALRFAALTPWYDRVVAWSTRDSAIKARVVALTAAQPGEQVLDLGCGTGTLMEALAHQASEAILTGVDADPAILRLALARIQAAHVPAQLVQGMSHTLPFADAHFDVAVSTLFFHHLYPSAKRGTVQELKRVLRPGGRVVVADFGRARSRGRRILFNLVRLLDGYANTRDHAAGTLAAYFREGGFSEVTVVSTLPVPLGSIDFLVAT